MELGSPVNSKNIIPLILLFKLSLKPLGRMSNDTTNGDKDNPG